MKFSNYEELVNHLKQISSQKEQLQEIIQYFLENVQFDYVMIEHINEIATVKMVKYIDRLFPNTNEKFREKALSYLRNTTNISNTYWERVRSLYLTPHTDAMGNNEYPTLTEAFISIEPEYIENNGLLVKGISEHISNFAKRLCNDIGIQALVVNGISSGRMHHFWLDVQIDNKELFYDIAYAIYIRDNFCGMGNRYLYDEWLGITPKQLHKNQPTRTIVYPHGFNLEYLGVNDIPLCMKQFFDVSA